MRAGAGFGLGAVLGFGYVMYEPLATAFDAALIIGGAGAVLATLAVFFGDTFWSWISPWWWG